MPERDIRFLAQLVESLRERQRPEMTVDWLPTRRSDPALEAVQAWRGGFLFEERRLLARMKIAANKEAFREQMEATILEHVRHDKFRVYGNVIQRSYRLRCRCGHPSDTWEVTMMQLRYMPRLREALQRIRQCAWDGFTQVERKVAQAADRRAKSLLHRALTREQRWSLRARDSFLVTGQDGHVYEISRGNVRRIENGVATVAYCIHPKEPLPVADLMLAHKLMLESALDVFLATANATVLGLPLAA